MALRVSGLSPVRRAIGFPMKWNVVFAEARTPQGIGEALRFSVRQRVFFSIQGLNLKPVHPRGLAL